MGWAPLDRRLLHILNQGLKLADRRLPAMMGTWPSRTVTPGHRRRVIAATAAVLAALSASIAAAVTLSQPVAATTVPGPPAGWTTVFSDSFAGQAGSPVSSANWKYDTGPGSSFGTGEIETMTNSTSNVF